MIISKKVFSKLGTVLILILTVSLVNPLYLSGDLPPQSPPQGSMTLKDYYNEYVKQIDPGIAADKGTQQGLPGFAEDALQAIGQIIMDKATTAAFDLLKKRVQRFLKCPGTGCSDPKSQEQWCFPATCQVIENIRFEEIVTARKVLYQGFIQDVLFNVGKKIEKVILPVQEKEVVLLLKNIVMDVLLEKLTNIIRPLDSISIGIITERFFDFFIRKLEKPDNIKKEVLQAALAALTVWKARTEAAGTKFSKASMKLFLDKILNSLGSSNPNLPAPGSNEYFRVLKTADLLHDAILLAASVNKKSIPKAWNNLVDILFETTYYIVDDTGTEYEKARYDTLQNGVNLQNATHILFIAKDIIDGAINKDINTIINSVSMVLRAYEKQYEDELKNPSGDKQKEKTELKKKYEDELKKLSEDKQMDKKEKTELKEKYEDNLKNLSADEQKKKVILKRKAIKMIGVVLLYAQTYTDKSLDEKTAQTKRTQLISSLVMERKERDRGGVISFGGSLRGIFQLNAWKKAIDETTGDSKSSYGPFSVPIGFGLDWYWGKSKGLHLEFDIVDLGHFTSFDGGSGVVEKPRLSDVFAPSATAGLFVGLGGYPLYLGLTYGYSPKYYIPENNSVKKGSLNWGFTLGIYIPLIDFN